MLSKSPPQCSKQPGKRRISMCRTNCTKQHDVKLSQHKEFLQYWELVVNETKKGEALNRWKRYLENLYDSEKIFLEFVYWDHLLVWNSLGGGGGVHTLIRMGSLDYSALSPKEVVGRCRWTIPQLHCTIINQATFNTSNDLRHYRDVVNQEIKTIP